jgi:hypothetical protein
MFAAGRFQPSAVPLFCAAAHATLSVMVFSHLSLYITDSFFFKHTAARMPKNFNINHALYARHKMVLKQYHKLRLGVVQCLKIGFAGTGMRQYAN